jgi:histidinol-phosphate aminotransferase
MAPYSPPEDAAALAARAGIPVSRVIKLDANENPYGCSPRVREALSHFGDYHRYPDPDQRAIRDLVAPWLGVPDERVVFGNGSDEIIDLLCRIYLDPGDEIVDCTPTFGMYTFSADLCAATTVEVPRAEDWRVDLAAVERALTPRTKLIFAASPNNPTGNRESEPAIRALAGLGPLLVLDEAYVEFSGEPSFARLCLEIDNLVVLRTFSKWAGLAGLRVGLAVVPDAVAAQIWRAKPPFNLNLAAETAVRATLEDRDWADHVLAQIRLERQRLGDRLSAVPGLTVWPSCANFLLVDAGAAAPHLREHLCSRGIAVRTYRHPRLQGAIRVSVGLPEHTDALMAAIQEWAAEGPPV